MKALIIDDEPMPAKHLKKLIEKHCFEITSVLIENSPIEAVKIINDNQFDIIFLDVEMPELNGFELLEEVVLPQQTKVIFTTAYSNYAIKAFEANATHYLLKMITKEKLILAVRKAINSGIKQNEAETSDRIISIYYNEEYVLLKENQILRLEAEKSYTNIITKDKKFLSSKGVGFYEKKLESKRFFRCHNSHIVNIAEVAKIGKGKRGYLVLSNDDVVPISNSKREEIGNILNV